MKISTDDSFGNDIEKGLVLMVFGASWCSPCAQLGKLLDNVEIDGLDIFKMDIQDNLNIPTEMGIRTVPTMALFKDGIKIGTQLSVQSVDALKIFIDKSVQSV